MARSTIDATTERRGRTLARRFRVARENSGMSQTELARVSGVSVETIRKIEQAQTTSPGVFQVVDLAEALKVKIHQLLNL